MTKATIRIEIHSMGYPALGGVPVWSGGSGKQADASLYSLREVALKIAK